MNIKSLQEQLSRIEEICVIGKNITLNSVICHVIGVVRYGNQMRLLVLEYDEDFQEQIDEAEEIQHIAMSNRILLRENRKFDMTSPFKAVNKVSIGEEEFEVHESENRRINTGDVECILTLSEFLRKGWQPEGIHVQHIDFLFLTSMKLEGNYPSIPTFDENPTMCFTMRPDIITGWVEQPINLIVGSHYPDKLWFQDADTNEEYWVQINQVYLLDIWSEMEKLFTKPKMQEHTNPEQILQSRNNFENMLVKICPRGMYFPVIEYESEKEISLEFFTRVFLDEVQISTSSTMGLMIGPKQSTGMLGSKLKAAIIQEPFPENTVRIEAELFSYLYTSIGNDIVIE